MADNIVILGGVDYSGISGSELARVIIGEQSEEATQEGDAK